MLQVHKSKIRFCQACGSPTKQVVPEGEEKLRAVCTVCGKIHYENPKMVRLSFLFIVSNLDSANEIFCLYDATFGIIYVFLGF